MAIDSSVTEDASSPHALRRLSLLLVVLAAGAAVGWACTTVLTPAEDVLDSTGFTYVNVANGEVGSTIKLNTAVIWTPVPVGTNLARGIVTSVDIEPGGEARQGTVLYSVNLRPVVVAQGSVPAFRAIGPGAEGADVKQLQQLLSDTGFFAGVLDGKYGRVTASAIRAWQKSLELPATGIVDAGDLMFVPELPGRLLLDSALIARGLSLSGGEQVVSGLPASPYFEIPITEAQVSLIPVGARAEISAPDGTSTWIGFVTDQTVNAEDGTIQLALDGEDGSSICGDSCGSIPVSGRTLLTTNVVTVESVAGLVVPSAALRSEADGRITVIDDGAKVHEVTVKASARGMSVVEGIDAGARLRVPASESAP